MKPWLLTGAGAAFVAISSFFAPEQGWLEAVSESFVPYGAVPLAVGYVTPRSRAAAVAVLGAGATLVMVLAFYLARPLLDPPYGVLWSELFYWSLIGGLSGALLAVIASWLRPRMLTSETKSAALAILSLALIQAGDFVYSGWGQIEVATDSGDLTIGYGTTDVVIASVVLAAFNSGIFFAAIDSQRSMSDSSSPHHPRPQGT